MMQHLYENDYLEGNPPSCVAVGHFDGVHRGHLALAKRLAAEAKARGYRSVLVSLYNPDTTSLATEKEKALLFEGCGVDILFSLEESWMIQAMHPPTFVRLILMDRLDARVVVAGAEQCNPLPFLETETCPLEHHNGEAIATAQLWDALDAGDLETYTTLAGRPYLMLGTIGHGLHLGQTVGMPTANLELPWYKRKPRNGVYATISTIGGALYMGLTNVGPRPTVDDSEAVTVETHLLDVNRDLYGEPQQLEFCFRIRDVMKFDDLGQVKAQVDQDLSQARDRLSELFSRRTSTTTSVFQSTATMSH